MSVVTWVGGAAGSYSVSLAVDWTGGVAPGAGDIASFSAAQTGPYTLLGDAGWAETVIEGDTVVVTGSITASDAQSAELLVDSGGMLTIAAGAAVTGGLDAQIGSGTGEGWLADYGLMSFGTITIGAQGVLGVGDTGTLAGDIVLDGGQLAAVGSTISLDNAIQLMNSSSVLASMPTGTLVLSGGVSGAYGLDVLNGTAVFAAVSSYTGATSIVAGSTVVAAADNALGSGVVALAGALLGAQTETLDNALQTSGNALIAAATGATLTLDGTAAAPSYSGNITIGAAGDAGVVALAPGYESGLAPSWVVAAGTLRESGAAGGLIAGFGLSIAAGAVLDLNGHADAAQSVQGTGIITSESAPAGFMLGNGVFAGTIAGQVGLTIQGSVTLTGAEIATGAVQIDAGAELQLGAGGGIGAFTAPVIENNGLLLADIGTSGTIASAIAGAGELVVAGSGAVALTADNQFSGGAVLDSGTLVLGNAGALGTGNLSIVGGTLSGAANGAVNNGIVLEGMANIGAGAGQTLDLAGHISGYGGGMLISQPGLVLLGGDNNYTGGTYLDGGALGLANENALGQGGVWLYAGTLLGAGAVANSVALYGAGYMGALAGQTLELTGAISGSGNIIANMPGLLKLGGANDYSGGTTLETGGAVEAGNADALGAGGVSFAGDGTLIVGQSVPLSETVEGFAAGDTIELAGFTASKLSYTSGVLTAVDAQGHVAMLALAGAYSSAAFTFSTDTAGTEIVVCYLRGTRIATPGGEMAIEHLRPGDMVTTRGGARRIKWIGEQRYARRFLQRDDSMLPVCIGAGALGEGVPKRDLFVSPGHSMLLDDVLVLASDLVNGVTITQHWAPDEVHYFNIELETHDCILAEGAWAETYADCPGLRAKFHNAADFYALYTEHVVSDEPLLCAPRPQGGAELAAALLPVVTRAAEETSPGRLRGYVESVTQRGVVTGWAQDEANPDLPVSLEILVDGMRLGNVLANLPRPDVRAARAGAGRCGFMVEAPAGAAVTVRRVATGEVLPVLRERVAA